MPHRDRVYSPSGRRRTAGDAPHRQGISPPSGGLYTRPKRRLSTTFGRRRVRLAMPRIATPDGSCRKSREAVSMSHYQCSLVSVLKLTNYQPERIAHGFGDKVSVQYFASPRKKREGWKQTTPPFQGGITVIDAFLLHLLFDGISISHSKFSIRRLSASPERDSDRRESFLGIPDPFEEGVFGCVLR
jgi:hypothetical protein